MSIGWLCYSGELSQEWQRWLGSLKWAAGRLAGHLLV